MSRELVKNVTGIYILEDGEVIESEQFVADKAAEKLMEEHELETKYPDAEFVILDNETIEDMSVRTVEEIHELQVKVAQELTQQQIRESGERDQLLVQSVRALEDLNEMNNDLSERLRPWFSLHFPELESKIGSNEDLAELLSQETRRDHMDEYADLAEESTGIPINDTDAQMIRIFASQLNNGYAVKEDLEQYVDVLAQEVVPNLSALLGGLLAARLVSLAGSLERLAKMPSSTIQVLGAEKAMFRHMKGEGSAPKHGVLFMHPFIQKIPNEKKGKMARTLANKAAIAARLDRYSGDFKGEQLLEEVEQQYEEL